MNNNEILKNAMKTTDLNKNIAVGEYLKEWLGNRYWAKKVGDGGYLRYDITNGKYKLIEMEEEDYLNEGKFLLQWGLTKEGAESITPELKEKLDTWSGNGGRSVRKSSKKSVKKECPVKTSRTYKGKDGVVRRLYKRAGDFFVRVKSKVTGKFGYRKVKV